jgi:hypothetical protein
MSGRKNVLSLYQIFTDADASADQISKVTNIQFLDNMCITLSFPGASGNGQFFIDVSTDNVNWSALDITPAMLLTDPDEKIIIDMNQLAASYIRARFVAAGGSGLINATIEGKQV